MRVGTVLRLGRVSNLPTVWTNALAASVLAGADPSATVLLIALILSVFYIGGMWLNDAFDAETDAEERPSRPIPAGEAQRGTVFLAGFALLAASSAAAFWFGADTGTAALGLAAAITLYDWLHKKTVAAPIIMGAARFLCYAVAAVAASRFVGLAVWGAVGIFAYIVGLTYAARQESYDRIDRLWPLLVVAAPVALVAWQSVLEPSAIAFATAFVALVAHALSRLKRRSPGAVPRAVAGLIAGICLYDAALIASTGAFGWAIIAASGFLLTLALQRLVPGT